GAFHRILIKHFIKIAHAKEQQRLWIPLFQLSILAHKWGEIREHLHPPGPPLAGTTMEGDCRGFPKGCGGDPALLRPPARLSGNAGVPYGALSRPEKAEVP